MGAVDPDDDSIHRYIVLHYRFDPSRNERRNVAVAAFDTQAEFFAELAARQIELTDLKSHGRAEPQELLSGAVKPAGYAEEQSKRDRGHGRARGGRVRKRKRAL